MLEDGVHAKVYWEGAHDHAAHPPVVPTYGKHHPEVRKALEAYMNDRKSSGFAKNGAAKDHQPRRYTRELAGMFGTVESERFERKVWCLASQ